MNFLNLPAYEITNVNENEHDYHVEVEAKDHPRTCQNCDAHDIVGFGRNVQMVYDLPMHGKRVGLYINTRRYQCRACNKTFFERLPDVDGRRMMTSRLVKWMGPQSIKKPFTHIADEVGVTENTVKNVFLDHIKELEQSTVFATPRVMGIDEIHIIGKPRCVVTNIEQQTAIELLPDRNKKSVINYLMRLKDRKQIAKVSMDMWAPYRDAVAAALPGAVVVVDKFHVVKMANEGLEAIRKEIRADLSDKQRRGLMHDRFILLKREHDLKGLDNITLESWTKNFPVLGDAYRAKEAFYAIYDAPSREEALERYRQWKARLLPKVADAFKPLTTAIGNWETEIFNYFEHQITNAFTESLNSLIRHIDRAGRGYSFPALRAKLLYTKGAQKVKKPKFQRHEPRHAPRSVPEYMDLVVDTNSSWPRVSSTRIVEPEINYGADISILVKMLEEGTL